MASGRGQSADENAMICLVRDGKRKPDVPGRRVTLPLVNSKRPGSLRIDNALIYDVISFP